MPLFSFKEPFYLLLLNNYSSFFIMLSSIFPFPLDLLKNSFLLFNDNLLPKKLYFNFPLSIVDEVVEYLLPFLSNIEVKKPFFESLFMTKVLSSDGLDCIKFSISFLNSIVG